jgi:hypothetical protein
MWEAPDQQTIIKERLDTGTVDVVVMICCSQEFKETGGQSDQAILDISSYALEQNPDTRIGLAMPWADYPSTYPSVDEHHALTDAAWPLYQQLAEDIGDELGAEVFAFYHGAAIYEVRHWLEQGLLGRCELPDRLARKCRLPRRQGPRRQSRHRRRNAHLAQRHLRHRPTRCSGTRRPRRRRR